MKRFGKPGLESETLGREHRRVPQNAFTLIELMVVIAVIGIAGVMIVPEMKGAYQDALLRAACRELVDTFQLAYSRAVSLNVDHRVRIDEGSHRYVIEAADPRSAPRSEFHPLKGFAGCEGKLDRRVSVRLRYPTAETQGEAASPGQGLEHLAHPEVLEVHRRHAAPSRARV